MRSTPAYQARQTPRSTSSMHPTLRGGTCGREASRLRGMFLAGAGLCPGARLLPDRVPDGLELEEARDRPGALLVRGAVDDPLDVVGREPLELRRRPSAPVTSIAFTSMWPASIGASSSRWPVRTLTTPPGTSEVAIASASSIAASGCDSEARTTAALPPTSTGARRETRPPSAGSSGARMATTPVGSGTEKLKYGPATGFEEPSTCAQLVRPARVPDDAVDRGLDLLLAGAHARRGRPRAPPSSPPAGRGPGRGCTRSRPPSRAARSRAASTASRASLREARATFCPSASYVRPDSERGNSPPR